MAAATGGVPRCRHRHGRGIAGTAALRHGARRSKLSAETDLAPWFKQAIYVLIAVNTTTYVVTGTASEALDSLAWLTLLLSFELESGHAGRFRQGRTRAVIRIARFLASLALLAALAGYWREKEWLDVANVSLWIAVVALLELEVRRPEVIRRLPRVFTGAAAALYSGLAALVVAWLLRGEWFDAYDAALWLFAFATLEMGAMRGMMNFIRTDSSAI